jgi:hypothetical protein
MSSFEEFWQEFQIRFSRSPVWLPGTTMELGDIGVADRTGFVQIARLSDFGIGFQPVDSKPDAEYFVTSESAQTEDFTVGATTADPTATVTSVAVGMRMTFSDAHGFVVRAKAVRGTRIGDVLAVEREIRRQHAEAPFWEKNWIYVQELVTARPCIMVVSAAEGGSATVSATASAGLTNFVQLLDAGVGLTLSDRKSIDQYITTPKRAPLMWRGRWLRGVLRKKFVSRGAWDEAELEAAGKLYEDFNDPSVFVG